MRKEDIRILWISNDSREIFDYCIAEFKAEDPESWPMHLYKRYNCDIGNCQKNWDQWTITDIFFEFGVVRNWDSKMMKSKFFSDIMLIEGLEYISTFDPSRNDGKIPLKNNPR